MEKKHIKIKCVGDSADLRLSALNKAIEFEEKYMAGRKVGVHNGIVWRNKQSGATYYVYHMKSEIIVECRKGEL